MKLVSVLFYIITLTYNRSFGTEKEEIYIYFIVFAWNLSKVAFHFAIILLASYKRFEKSNTTLSFSPWKCVLRVFSHFNAIIQVRKRKREWDLFSHTYFLECWKRLSYLHCFLAIYPHFCTQMNYWIYQMMKSSYWNKEKCSIETWSS